MQQAKAPHNPVQVHAETRQNKGAAQESPQGEHIAQLDAMVDASPALAAQRKLTGMIHNSPAMAAQRKTIDGIHGNVPAQREEAPAKPNHTGLPDNLKTGIESLSGLSMDNVKVHYNSSQPAQLNALAYAQGTDIHVAPGQEQHLPHEAWHVVQQAQGRVKPTMQMKDGVPVNDDTGLEREADVMGREALLGNKKDRGQSGEVGCAMRKVELSSQAVQLTRYADPTDIAISGLMNNAGINNFGPYEWDDSIPMFKLSAGFVPTVADCVDKTIYQPEDATKAVLNEKGKASLVSTRRKVALKAVFGVTQGICEKIMGVNDGASPRDFVSLAAEDGYTGGHSDQRHILGKGIMKGNREVALRAAFWKVGATAMDLDAAGTASVFASETEATNTVSSAINADLIKNWAAHRMTLAKGTQVKINAAVNSNCVAYTKKDAPSGTPYPDSDMPKYIDTSKSGDRELYSGDYSGAGRPTDVNAPDSVKQPLTFGGAAAYTHVYVIVDPKVTYPGGWGIYTAYPKP